MAAQQALATAECPVARTVDLVGDRWSLLIVRDVFDGITRFGELQRSLGLSRNILTERLRTLVTHGLLRTIPASDGTAYREYVLTDKGNDLFTVVVALRQFGEKHLFADGEQRSQLLGAKDDRPLRELQPRSANGRVVRPGQTYVRKVTTR